MKIKLFPQTRTVPLETLRLGDSFLLNNLPFTVVRHGALFAGKISDIPRSTVTVLDLNSDTIVSLDRMSEVTPIKLACVEESNM